MALRPIKLQRPAVPVDVAGWRQDEDFGVFPLGAKPKRLLICPLDCDEPALIPGHRYLFKTAHGWRAQQMWSEIIAYFVGCALGIEVPPCFVARDGSSGDEGVLVEYFLNFPDEARKARLIHGADLMGNIRMRPTTANPVPGDDVPQSIHANIRLCAALGIKDSAIWWARCLAFDALIGNVDRHTENWGVLTRGLELDGTLPIVFAPVFDNGTSLGYEITDKRITQAWDDAAISSYVSRGRHHAGWNAHYPGPTPHVQLCRMIGQIRRTTLPSMVEMTQIDLRSVLDFAEACTQFPMRVNFSARRAEFVGLLIAARRERLSAALGGM